MLPPASFPTTVAELLGADGEYTFAPMVTTLLDIENKQRRQKSDIGSKKMGGVRSSVGPAILRPRPQIESQLLKRLVHRLEAYQSRERTVYGSNRFCL